MITRFSTPPIGTAAVLGVISLVATTAAARGKLLLRLGCRGFETIQETGLDAPTRRRRLLLLREKGLALLQAEKRAMERSLKEEEEEEEQAQEEEEVEGSEGRESPQETAVAATAIACKGKSAG